MSQQQQVIMPIEHQQIRGITVKLLITVIIHIIVATSLATFYYLKLQQGQTEMGHRIETTNATLQAVVGDVKENMRLQKLQNDAFQQQLEESKIQIVIIETKLGIQSPYTKN